MAIYMEECKGAMCYWDKLQAHRKNQKCQHGNSLCNVVCKVPEKDKESSRLLAAVILFGDILILFLFGKQECALTLKLRKLGTVSW